MKRPPHAPQRTCVACRQVRAKSHLLRVVRTPLGELRVDTTGRLPGRGAYICENEPCLVTAVKQHKLGRALGLTVGPELENMIREHLRSEHSHGASAD